MSKVLAFILALLLLFLLFYLAFSGSYMKPIFILASCMAIIASIARAAMSIITIKTSDNDRKVYDAKLYLPRCIISFIIGLGFLVFSICYLA